MKPLRPLTTLALALALAACGAGSAAPAASPSPPPSRGDSEDDEGMKPYAEVVTADMESRQGLFDVHTGDDFETVLYEIPNELLGEDLLLVSRVARTPEGAGYGGSKVNTSVVRWERKGDRVLLRLVSYENVAADTLPVAAAVASSNLEPLIHAFDIEAISPDSAGVVIEATDLYTTDVPLLGLPSFRRERYGVRRLDTDRTFVDWIRTFPENVEVRRLVTYEATEAPSDQAANTVTVEMHHSMVRLPSDPMEPRLCDARVGFFDVELVDYGLDTQRATERCFITRWRLEPQDPGALARGELTDPVEPIVYYIDPATPAKWRPYLKQGVEDWQAAFEEAGFSNAIVARDAPTPAEDPDWHPEDARYSVIRYLASDVQNASGPHVHDPRTGEILESDIQWYHNVMNLLRNWYFTQTAAVNPEARGVEFDDEVMGELVRFVSAHEVGHTLGLQHNMQASAAYPVDSLRTRFTCRMGVAPSIMDYARFNYVAQPGDDTCLLPLVGPYDKFAIEWGYKPVPGDPEAERDELDRMVREMQADPVYRFSSPTGADPTALTEAIGDDAMVASDYGVENLKRIAASLMDWTFEEGEDYEQLEELYGNLVSQWGRYAGHVVTNVGGVVQTRKVQGQAGPVFEPVPAERQERAVEWLNRQVFATPEWLLDAEVLRRIQGSGVLDLVRRRQESALEDLLDVDVMTRLVEQEAFEGDDAYTLGEMLDDVRAGVWSEARTGRATDPYRRNLQRAWLERMDTLMVDPEARTTDVAPFARGQLEALRTELQRASPSHRATRLHYRDALARIEEILEPGE